MPPSRRPVSASSMAARMNSSVISGRRTVRHAGALLAQLLQAVQVVAPVEVVDAVRLVGKLLRVLLHELQERLALAFVQRERKRVVLPGGVAADARPPHQAWTVQRRLLHQWIEISAEREVNDARVVDGCA